MAVLSAVVQALDAAGVSGWQREIAETLAGSLDGENPNASMAKELKQLMLELTGDAVEKKADVSDDLASKRDERRRAAGS